MAPQARGRVRLRSPRRRRGRNMAPQARGRARLRPPRRRRGRTCTRESASATSAAPPRSHLAPSREGAKCDLCGAAEVANWSHKKIFYAMLQSVICFSARESTGATSAEPARSHSASSREAAKCDLGRRGGGEAGGGAGRRGRGGSGGNNKKQNKNWKWP